MNAKEIIRILNHKVQDGTLEERTRRMIATLEDDACLAALGLTDDDTEAVEEAHGELSELFEGER